MLFFFCFVFFVPFNNPILKRSDARAHTGDTHSGYGERCQCASVHLNRAGVLPLQYTHTHTRQTQSSRSKPDRFDMLSFSIPKGEEMCVCLCCVCFTCIQYHSLQLPRRKFQLKIYLFEHHKCILSICFYRILNIIGALGTFHFTGF